MGGYDSVSLDTAEPMVRYHPEYFKVLTNDSLAERKKFNKAEAYRAFIACRIGEVRLIDNIILT